MSNQVLVRHLSTGRREVMDRVAAETLQDYDIVRIVCDVKTRPEDVAGEETRDSINHGRNGRSG